MPVTLPSPTEETIVKQETVVVNVAKIVRIDISVERAEVGFVVGYGYNDEEGKFVEVKREVIMVSGVEFSKLGSIVVEEGDVGKSIYDLISEKSYEYLLQNNML